MYLSEKCGKSLKIPPKQFNSLVKFQAEGLQLYQKLNTSQFFVKGFAET